MENKTKKLSNSTVLYIFLIINAIGWSLLQLTRNIISIDSMEAIRWGELVSFGTNKHPPLSGWLLSGFYHLTGNHDFFVYLFGQICILVGFVFVYKLAKCFLDEEKAVCATIVVWSCSYYTYQVFVDNYNCNVLLMALWPMIVYYFYKSVRENRLTDWILLGVSAGLGVLGKYQVVFLFLAMFLYLICIDREQFKKKGLYISAITGFLIVLPHIVWLFQNDFFSFAYMLERTDSQTHNLPLILVKFSHIFYPIKFIFGQLLAVVGCIAIFLLTALQAKNISVVKDSNKKNTWFLLIVALVPIIAQGCMGLITGNRVPSIWGSVMVSMAGIILFYFFPVNFKENTFKFCVSLTALTVFGFFIGVTGFAIFQTKSFIASPSKILTTDFNTIWDDATNNAPLKYIGGDMEHAFQFRFYNERNPRIVLETFGHKNPWENHEDILKSGILIVSGDGEKDVIAKARDLVYLLPKDYKIIPKKYKYDVCNKVGKCESNDLYYVVIPPLK